MQPVYQKSGITIYHGDALHILPQLQESIDCVITDPPYSSGGQFRGDRAGQTTREKYDVRDTKLYAEFSGDNRDQRGFGFWCSLWLAHCHALAAMGSPIAMFTDWRQLPTVTDAMQAGGFVWRGIGVWDKTEGARPAKGRYRNQSEFVAWGSKGPMNDSEGPCLPGVWRAAVNAEEKLHQSGKPLSVMKQLCRIAWRPGSVILDPFIGSGTTLVAAKALNIAAVGIEIDANQIDVAVSRLSQQSFAFSNDE